MVENTSSGQEICARLPQPPRRASAEDKPRTLPIFESELFIVENILHGIKKLRYRLRLIDKNAAGGRSLRERLVQLDQMPWPCRETRSLHRVGEVEDESVLRQEIPYQGGFAGLASAKENMDKRQAYFLRKQGRKCSFIVIHKAIVLFYSRNVKCIFNTR